MGEFAIGQSVSRFEDPRLLRGGGRYVGDIVLPGMTFGYVLRSPHAHARIRSIDASRAKAAPGVLAVLTGADWQASGWGDLPVPGGLKRRDGTSFRPPYAALAKADHIIMHHFVINRVTAASMEPRGSVGDYNAAEERYTVYTTLQRTHPFRAELAPILKVPESKIRVIAGDIGGSFGMKSAVYNEVALVLLASKVLGRPVKWTSTRSESFLCDAQARDNVTTAELALDRNGIFLGLRVHTIASIGAYLQTGMPAFTGNLGTLAGVYRTPAIHADVTAVYTHTNPVRPYRGNGRPETAYVIERLVELAADETGIDPIELRRRNMIPPEAMPFKTGLTFTYDCGEFEKVFDEGLRRADVAGFPKRRAAAEKRGRLRGLGISYSIERAGTLGFEGAEVRFDRSGALTLFSGSVTQGQGHETVFKQLVCDRLGIHPDQTTYVQGDTDKVFFGQGTGGSRSATLAGSAFHGAVEKVLEKGRTLAAHLLGIQVADVNFAEGIFSSPKTNRTLTMQDVARAAVDPAKLPKDMEGGLTATSVYRADVENYPNGCHVCEVEIDRDTGALEVARYIVIDAVGKVLNTMLL